MKTIVAISSPVGAGGIGIVRMSGDDVVSIASKVFQTKNNINYDVYPMMMHFGTFIGLDFKDKGYLVYFPKEKAFTGEPTVEEIATIVFILESLLSEALKLRSTII